MTKEQLQAAVDEIRGVCKKHGVVLIGTCNSEGIHGEITIEPVNGTLSQVDRESLTNRLDEIYVYSTPLKVIGYSVNGIGDPLP